MRDENGEEVIEPGEYDLGDNKTLHVFITGAQTDEPTLWACTAYDHGPMCFRCREVDDVLNALLLNVIDGRMLCTQDPDTAEFQFKVTPAGEAAVKAMLGRMRVDDTPPSDGGAS